MPALALKTDSHFHSSGGRLVAVDGRTLPLKAASVKADAKGGLVRVVLTQRFANSYPDPLSVTYTMPLPADGAVSGYAFILGDKRIVGEVDRKASARERFEQALVDGRTAALLDQERTSLFTQQVGNIPPGVEVICELTVDQKLAWLPEGEWEWRFPTVAAPRYLGTEGRVTDANLVSVDVASSALPAQVALDLKIRDVLSGGRRPESPSHGLRPSNDSDGWNVRLGDDRGAELDRDLVVRWAVAQPRVGLSLDWGRTAPGTAQSLTTFGLLTLVPPAPGQTLPPIARDLIVLLDTSGSMSGEPLDQARRVVAALIATLHERDRLEMIEFSSAPRRWKRGAVNATDGHKKDALHWLGKLRASGGTEMREGVLEALAPLNPESQRQVVLVTDGLIGFEAEIISTLLEKLPAASRFHTVGVGSEVNRSLTGPTARAGKGVEVVVGLGEDPDRAARRLVSRTDAPQIVELELDGSALLGYAPQRLPDLYAGAPALLSVNLKPEGGRLIVRGRSHDGAFEQQVDVSPIGSAAGSSPLGALFARERVEDLEMQIASGRGPGDADHQIERLGIEFQISTRLTSWVAVSQDVTVDPRAPSRRETMPQAVPYGMSIEGLGLRGSASVGYPAAPSAAAGPAQGFVGGAADLFKEARQRIVTRAGSISADDEDGAPSELTGAPLRPVVVSKPSAPASSAPKRKDEMQREQKKGGESRRRRSARGRIVINNAGQLVFELTSSESFTWDPSRKITLMFADGRVVELVADAGVSTQGGVISAGLVVRVVVRWAEASSVEPQSATIESDDGLLEVSF